MYKYIRIQLLADDAQMLRRKTSDLKKFATLFGVKLHKVPFARFEDTFLIDLPEDELDFCHLANAVNSFCYFCGNAHRLASERVTVPFDDFLKILASE